MLTKSSAHCKIHLHINGNKLQRRRAVVFPVYLNTIRFNIYQFISSELHFSVIFYLQSLFKIFFNSLLSWLFKLFPLYVEYWSCFVWHEIFAAIYFCGLAIFCFLRELIFAIRTDWFLLLRINFWVFSKVPSTKYWQYFRFC